MKWFFLVCSALALSACPVGQVVCKAGTVPCGNGCVDEVHDRRNCGACGNQCTTGEDCIADAGGAGVSACECRAGTTVCGSSCAVTDSDVHNCGGCGVECGSGRYCQTGGCVDDCSAGFKKCGFACVDALTDGFHCGGCDIECAQGQTCVAGICDYPAVAACYWSGQLIGFNPDTKVMGPLSDVGNNPGPLARFGQTVLAADGTDNRLYQAVPSTSGLYELASKATTTGAVPNHALVDGDFVYVANAGAGTLQVLQKNNSTGVVDLGAGVAAPLTLGTAAELQLGQNTFPQAAAKVGTTLYVPLYGGYGAEAADAGQAVQLIDVSTPTAPTLLGRVSLKGLDLHAFDGGSPVARPWAVTALGDTVYVALSNLNPDSYAVEGPGMLARVFSDGGVDALDLSAVDCLNPQWVTTVGSSVAVSCGGRATYDANYAITAIEASGVVLVSNGVKTAAWSGASCSGGGDCKPLFPGRMTAQGTKLLVTDQNGGRLVVLDTAAGLTEVHGVNDALSLCPAGPSGAANVADVNAR